MRILSPTPSPKLRGAVVVMTCLAVVCSGTLSCKRKPIPKDTLVVLIEKVSRDLDPRSAMTSNDTKLSRLIAPGLTTSDTMNLEPALYLAASIEPVAPLQWRATLKPGLQFSDGSPVTASDVAFTYTSVLDETSHNLYRGSFTERFVRVVATGELQVDFFLHKPLGTLLSDLDFGIISKAAASKNTLIGAGPYALKSFAPERVLLEKNVHYQGPGPSPHIPHIEVKTVRDSNARNLMLVAGTADFSQNTVRADLVNIIAERDRIAVAAGRSAILTYLMMHNEDPILSDIRVRHAIALAIDRQRIVATKLGDHGQVATGLLPHFHWAYNGAVQTYAYDPERAKQLLDEAGFPDPDGPGGTPRLTLSYKTSASQFRLAVARVISAQLAEVGIAIEVHSFEFGTFFADVKEGRYQLASMQTSPISEPDFYYTYFHSSRIPTEKTPHTHNRWRYRSARVDDLTIRGRASMQRSERVELYGQIQKILAEDLPIIPLWHEDNIAILNKNVAGYTVLPNGRLSGFAATQK